MQYLLVLCALAVGHSVFLAAALLILNRKTSNRLLALLLFLLAVRTGKSVAQMILAPDMGYELSVLGVVAMASAGPVLLLLIRSLSQSSFRVPEKAAWHFVPAGLLLSTFVFHDWHVLNPAYYLATAHILIYTGLTGSLVFRSRELLKADDIRWRWTLYILGGVSLLELTFVLQVTVYVPVIYTTNLIVAVLIFYGLSLWGITRSKLFLAESVSKPGNTSVLNELGKRIQVSLEADHLYTDTNLTISLLANRLKVPPYLVSKAVNHFFNMSFSELLLQYRIRKAVQLLTAPDSRTYTVEAIAYESGFNTLSAFYTAFKKIHRTTPAQFRDNKGGASLKIA